jgi:hypothetical protein
MDPGQWKVTECEPDAIAESSLDALDVVVRLSRVGALVVAVLEDHVPARPTAGVIDSAVERLQLGRATPRRGRVNHGDAERACPANGDGLGGS